MLQHCGTGLHPATNEFGKYCSQKSRLENSTHHAEGLVDPKVLAKKTVIDFGYPQSMQIPKI
jgi:hypothetical protein